MEAPSEVARQRARYPDAHEYERIRLSAWLGAMVAEVGVASPSAENVLTLALETTAFVTRRIHSVFPEVVSTLDALAARGYKARRPARAVSCGDGGEQRPVFAG